jgi:predicted cupin superfamily sugar epimerase
MMSAEDIIRLLDLKPHPEGGHYAETWRAPAPDGGRAAGTAIYFLLKAGERSHWHRVDAAEAWHWYGGAPLCLDISADGETTSEQILGLDLAAGQRPQAVVPAHQWQAARSLGAWSLVGCTVSPAFEFAGFEMAPSDWRPRDRGEEQA